MSTDTPQTPDSDESLTHKELKERVAALENRVAEIESDSDEQQKLSIIATKGTLDMAYPPLILASTAAAFGYEVTVFHTF